MVTPSTLPRTTLAVLVAMSVLGTALAQPIVGSVETVQGLVTVSDATSVNTVLAGQPIVDGARFVTSSTGTTTLKINKTNCEVDLKPNQSVTIDQNKPCAVLLAAVQTLPGTGTVVATAGATSAFPVELLATGILAAALLTQKTSTGAPAGGGGQIPISGQ